MDIYGNVSADEVHQTSRMIRIWGDNHCQHVFGENNLAGDAYANGPSVLP